MAGPQSVSGTPSDFTPANSATTPPEALDNRRREDAGFPENLRELASAVANGDAVFFVGAGLSAVAGAPTWNEVVGRLRSRLIPPTSEESLPLVAQFFRNQFDDN